MKRFVSLLGCLLLLGIVPAQAQLPPSSGITIGITPVSGGTNTNCLTISAGKVGQAACSSSSSVIVGTTTITGGTTTRILYDNAGVLGEYTISGTGTVVAMAAGPTFTTPTLGVASATSLAINSVTAQAAPTFATAELQFWNNTASVNVVTFQNRSTSGFSALTFRGTDNIEHGALGYGGSATGAIFGTTLYLESSNEAGSGPNGTPPDIAVVQSGTLAGAAATFYNRQKFFGSNGDIKLFRKDGTTSALHYDGGFQTVSLFGSTGTAGLVQLGTNGVYVAAPATSNSGNVFSIHADSTTFSTVADANSSLVRLEQLGNASSFLAFQSNTYTNTDGQMRSHLGGTSSTAPNLTIRNDGTGSWINYQAAVSNNILMQGKQGVGLAFATGLGLAWSNSATDASATKTTGLYRIADGVVGVGTGAAGSVAGEIRALLGTFGVSGIVSAGPIKRAAYTVATLPASPGTGAMAYVSDAVACTFLAGLTGGASTFCPVIYNGSAWVAD